MPERFDTTTDPACGMRVDPATAKAHVEFEGARYYFCSRHCAETFSLDPAKFCRHPARRNPFRFRSAMPGRTPGRKKSQT